MSVEIFLDCNFFFRSPLKMKYAQKCCTSLDFKLIAASAFLFCVSHMFQWPNMMLIADTIATTLNSLAFFSVFSIKCANSTTFTTFFSPSLRGPTKMHWLFLFLHSFSTFWRFICHLCIYAAYHHHCFDVRTYVGLLLNWKLCLLQKCNSYFVRFIFPQELNRTHLSLV